MATHCKDFCVPPAPPPTQPVNNLSNTHSLKTKLTPLTKPVPKPVLSRNRPIRPVINLWLKKIDAAAEI